MTVIQDKIVLVVDDSDVSRTLIRYELENEGYHVIEASDGNQALSCLLMGPFPDLIVLDIHMPKLDGFETLKRIYNQQESIDLRTSPLPVIFITSNDSFQVREKGFYLGATDFLSKPFQKGDVIKAVNKIFNPTPTLQGSNALIVEDNPVALEVVSCILKREGVNIFKASDGIEAYEIVCNKMDELDILISDIRMPRMDGSLLTEKIRNELNLQDLPIIFLTAVSDHSRLLSLFKCGATDYIIKPFVKEELLARLTVHLKSTQLNKRLKKTIVRLQELNEMKTNLIAVCSHDLKTPLNGILNMSELMLTKPYLQVEDQEIMNQIIQNGTMLNHIINDILDFSKLESHQRLRNIELIKVSEIIISCINALKCLADEKHQQIIFNNEFQNAYIMGNRIDMTRVINNILSNAIKFTPSNGQITIFLQNGPKGLIEILISDTGVGIPEKNLPYLFDLFTSISKDGTEGEKGTGMGLAIMKRIIETHQGAIDVSSKIKEGTTFKIYLPFVEPAAPIDPQTQTVTNHHSQSGYRILLVDDSIINIKVSKRLLEKLGHRVTVVESGIKAIEMTQANHYDLIFMDIMMPDMNGIEATQIIRKYNSTIPIIALSGIDGQEYIDTCFKAGMNDYLNKPYKYDQLVQMLNKWAG